MRASSTLREPLASTVPVFRQVVATGIEIRSMIGSH